MGWMTTVGGVPTLIGPPRLRSVSLSLAEARPLVQAIVVLRFVTGAALVGGGLGVLASGEVVRTGLAWVLANTAVYLFNGLCDIATDRANGRSRPLARGDLDPAAAAWVCAGLVASAVLVAPSPPALVLVVLLLAAGAVYSHPPARLRTMATPFASVAIGGAGTYAAAAVAAGGGGLVVGCFALAMTGWMVVVGAVLKDLADVEGDRRAGRRTPALRFGVTRAAGFGSAAAGVLAAGLLVASALPHCTVLLAPATCLLVSAVLVRRRVRRIVPGDHASLRAPYRVFMLGQYAAHVALLGLVAR
jgi:4-hydroxybenzoate polyprenyltransferase